MKYIEMGKEEKKTDLYNEDNILTNEIFFLCVLFLSDNRICELDYITNIFLLV